MAGTAKVPKTPKRATSPRRTSAEVAADKAKAVIAKSRWSVDKAAELEALEMICATSCVIDCESSGKRYMMGDEPPTRKTKAGPAPGLFKFDEAPDPAVPFGDQITELAAVSIHDGRLLFSELVKPAAPYQARAWEIAREAGISEADLANARPFVEVFNDFLAAIAGFTPYAWNATFDTRLFEQSCARSGWALAETRRIFKGFHKTGEGSIGEGKGRQTYALGTSSYEFRYGLHCHDAMKPYGLLVGRGHYTKLSEAAAEQGIEFEGAAHRAAEDCRITAAVLRRLRDRLLNGEAAR